MNHLRSPVAWFGGKGPLIRKLIPLLPPHRTYVEPFGGGASLLCAKPPSPLEVYNDIDEALVNFWRVLRNPEQFQELHRLLVFTPHSRQEFEEAAATWEDADSPVERAYRWFVRARQAFSAVTFGSLGWTYCVTESKRGMSASTSRWLTAIEGLPAIHQRWMRVQIEHDDWRIVLDRYDTPQTLFYCDPPYVPETRSRGSYRHELTLEDHEDLVERLLRLQGMVILSGYAHPVYGPLESAGWQRVDFPTVSYAAGRTRKTGLLGDGVVKERQGRVESVWISPNARQSRQMTLFDEQEEVGGGA